MVSASLLALAARIAALIALSKAISAEDNSCESRISYSARMVHDAFASALAQSTRNGAPLIVEGNLPMHHPTQSAPSERFRASKPLDNLQRSSDREEPMEVDGILGPTGKPRHVPPEILGEVASGAAIIHGSRSAC